jgi:poly-gamma-glutamate synthesis protein (capsule biosynthesis protein)
MSQDGLIALCLCGDVMTGRGVDQVLPHPSSPLLYEPHVRDAREYVRLAERMSGPIAQPVEFAYVWGDALAELRRAGVDVRIVNLETSITTSDDAWRGKRIHYRMHPRNIGCLVAARVDCCTLANNHVLDWGYAGLAETLHALDRAGIAYAGAGQDAAAPAVVGVPGEGRVLVFSLGATSSGIPRQWGATSDHLGVNLFEDLSEATARRVAAQVRATKHPGEVAVASIHWGDNWGYDVPDEEVRFAHTLVDGGADLVHGHSSHHPKALEVYRGKLILYSCGDFLDDYEGISGYEAYRDDLRLMYLVRVDARAGQLRGGVPRPAPGQAVPAAPCLGRRCAPAVRRPQPAWSALRTRLEWAAAGDAAAERRPRLLLRWREEVRATGSRRARHPRPAQSRPARLNE